MNQQRSSATTDVDPLLNQTDQLSPSAIPTTTAATPSSGTVAYDEYLKDEEMDGSDEISDDSGHDGVSSKYTPLREQDRFLPIANIAKIMKRAIPENGKIAKDSRECIQECVSEFISFVTSEASDRCHQEKRKTINGDDILFAMLALGFDHYAEPLTLYLHKYRETTKTDRTMPSSGSANTSRNDSTAAAAPSSGPNNTTISTANNNPTSTTTVELLTTTAAAQTERHAATTARTLAQQQHHHHQHQQNDQRATEVNNDEPIFFYSEEEEAFTVA